MDKFLYEKAVNYIHKRLHSWKGSEYTSGDAEIS